jgi:O-6-methylguanine DNA methyltransferase
MRSFVTEFDLAPNRGVASLSKRYPQLTWDVRPFGFRWMLRCSGPPGAIADFREGVKQDQSFVWVGRSSDEEAVLAYAPKVEETAILRRIAEKGGFILPPMTVKDGLLRVRLVTSCEATLFDRDGPVAQGRLVSRRRLTAERLEEELERQFPGAPALTGRQAEVLLEAVRAGYYEVPRRSTVEDIARRLSLGRSTTEEHLRIAESTVVRSAAPTVALSHEQSVGAPAGEPVEHFVRYSSELQLYVDLALRAGQVTAVRFRRSVSPTEVERDHPYLHRILAHIRTGRTDLDRIPVELRVGRFEKQVLEEIRRIPIGETRTYAEIASRVGRPRAVRAVGNACAHNPAIVVIPCHRVVPSHGGIGQYSGEGGSETKRRLLRTEGAIRDLLELPARPFEDASRASGDLLDSRRSGKRKAAQIRLSLKGQ